VTDPGPTAAPEPSRLRRALGDAVRGGLGRLGYDLVRRRPGQELDGSALHDLDDDVRATWEAVRPYTLTSIERVTALVQAVRHLVRTGVDGDVVECGVWRGGSMLAAVRTLLAEGDASRTCWLYDTFTRMPPPGERDYDVWGRHASAYFEGDVDPHDTDGYRYLPLEEVRALLEGTGYPPERLRFVQGLVEETIPAQAPERIALLRLDTDWYESTAHELRHLLPRVVDGGLLLVDDYGQFVGARQAVDEALATLSPRPFLHRIDWTGRLAVLHRR
jgi:O-methyltransferase